LLGSVKDVEYAEAIRDLKAGEPLRSSDLRRATLVRIGQQVTMIIGEKNSFQVAIQLEALQDGRMGEQVKLKNPDSGRQVAGVVVGPNQVKGL
jgi:flagella basal body P-ring formation protein FlgA